MKSVIEAMATAISDTSHCAPAEQAAAAYQAQLKELKPVAYLWKHEIGRMKISRSSLLMAGFDDWGCTPLFALPEVKP